MAGLSKDALEKLSRAVERDDADMAREAMSEGAGPHDTIDAGHPSGNGGSVRNAALSCAAMFGSTGVLRAMIEAGADVDERPVDGDCDWTALFYAAIWNRPDAVALLLAVGADPLARDAQGKTAGQHVGRGAGAERIAVREMLRAAATAGRSGRH